MGGEFIHLLNYKQSNCTGNYNMNKDLKKKIKKKKKLQKFKKNAN
jgi:hypothetical protein